MGDVEQLVDLTAALAIGDPLQCLGLLVICQLLTAAKADTFSLRSPSAVIRAAKDALTFILGQRA